MGFRVKNEDEIAGIDTVVHGEEGYALDADLIRTTHSTRGVSPSGGARLARTLG